MVVSRRDLFPDDHQQPLAVAVIALPSLLTRVQPEVIGDDRVIEAGALRGRDDLWDRHAAVVGIGRVEVKAAGVVKHEAEATRGWGRRCPPTDAPATYGRTSSSGGF